MMRASEIRKETSPRKPVTEKEEPPSVRGRNGSHTTLEVMMVTHPELWPKC